MNKKLLMIFAALGFAVSQSSAQMPGAAQVQQVENKSKPAAAEKAKTMLDKITSAAHITPDQAKKVLPLLEEYYGKLEASKKSEPAKAGSETTAAKENLFTKLKGVVSADQLEKVKGLISGKMGKL